MSYNLKFSASLKNLQQDAITTKCGASALLDIYSGTQPAGPDTGITGQVKLATLICNATFAPAAAGGVVTLNAIASGTGLAGAGAGTTATWYRISHTTGPTPHVDGSIGTAVTNALTASIAGGLLTVTVAATATLAVGQQITGAGVPAGTFITALGTGTGGTGTYYLNNAVTLGSQAMTASTVFDPNLNNTSIATGQTVSISPASLTNKN